MTSLGYVHKTKFISLTHFSVTFCNISCNGHGSPFKLRGQRKAFMLGEQSRCFVYLEYKRMRGLPC